MVRSVRQAMIKNKQSKKVVSQLRNAYMDSLYEEVQYFCRVRLPMRFTRGNAARFGWPPLDPKYAIKKIRRLGAQPMLVATGHLKNTIVNQYKINIDRLNMKVKVTFPNAPDYANYLDSGAFPGSNGPRPFLNMTATEKQNFEQGVQRRLRSKLKRMKPAK